jgi:hypothetical protein
MKTMKNKILITAALLATVLFISSCLKDNVNIDWSGVQGKMYAQFTLAGYWSYGFNPQTAPIMYSVQLNIASNTPPTQDVTVTLAIDTAVLGAYNRAQLALDSTFVFFQLYPHIKIPTTAVIKAGSRTASINVEIDSTTAVDVTQKWMVPLSLVSVSSADITVATNMNTYLLSLVIKNKYDGIYSSSGTMVDVTNANFTGYYPNTIELISTGAFQCAVQDNTIGGIYHAFLNAGNLSYYGNFGLVVNFNPDGSGNIVSVTNYWGQPASNTRSAELDPTGVNKWDSSTKDIQIKYFMKQPSVVSAPPNIRTMFDETWTYTGARP